MAKSPPIGRCVHCLAENVKRNWDHVFPKGWYPDSTPPNTSKWIVPACVPCNSRLGKIEQRMLTSLALCIDSKLLGTAGITARVMRSMTTADAKDEQDAAYRRRLGTAIVGGLLHGEDIPDHQEYPGLGERWGRRKEEMTAVRIPVAYFEALAEKIARGMTYVEEKRYIEKSEQIAFYTLDESADASPLQDALRDATDFDGGPGIRIRRVADLQTNVSVMAVHIWQTFDMYVTVTPVEKPSLP